MTLPTTGLTIHRARSFWSRLGGLLARPALRDDEALYLAPCSSVHTCFMRYPIDVVFVDRGGRAMKIVPHLKPWRAAACWGAHGALELRAGRATHYGAVRGFAGLSPEDGRSTVSPDRHHSSDSSTREKATW
jgi:uncharacterized membrane protein (UPF0127 family)